MSAHTPGPWAWFGNTKGNDLQLATTYGGRRFVMTFKRWGMSSAQPCFQTTTNDGSGVMTPAGQLAVLEVPYRADVVAIDHPDARLIASAPELLEACKAALSEAGCDGELCAHEWHDKVRAAIAKAEGR